MYLLDTILSLDESTMLLLVHSRILSLNQRKQQNVSRYILEKAVTNVELDLQNVSPKSILPYNWRLFLHYHQSMYVAVLLVDPSFVRDVLIIQSWLGHQFISQYVSIILDDWALDRSSSEGQPTYLNKPSYWVCVFYLIRINVRAAPHTSILCLLSVRVSSETQYISHVVTEKDGRVEEVFREECGTT